MKLRRRPLVIAAAATAAALALSLALMPAVSPGLAQDHGGPGMAHGQDMPDHAQMPGDMAQHQGHAMTGMHDRAGAKPQMPGQDAFGAIQEIVQMLEADPGTDWSKVDLEALRQHFIDMNEVMLEAAAAAKPIDGGVEIAITGSGRTVAAIQRMVPEHAREIDGLHGWKASTAALPDGVLLTVTAADAKEVAHIRGLGFAGIIVSGSHHQPHHLAMARGEAMHGR